MRRAFPLILSISSLAYGVIFYAQCRAVPPALISALGWHTEVYSWCPPVWLQASIPSAVHAFAFTLLTISVLSRRVIVALSSGCFWFFANVYYEFHRSSLDVDALQTKALSGIAQHIDVHDLIFAFAGAALAFAAVAISPGFQTPGKH